MKHEALSKRQWELDAVLLWDGHIDRISGPRCMIQMREGPDYGLYRIGKSDTVLRAGTAVFYDEITRSVRPTSE